MKPHHNTGNQYAKKDDTLDAQITFRTRQEIKNAMMRKKDELGVEKLTDLMNLACEFFLTNFQQFENPINQDSAMKPRLNKYLSELRENCSDYEIVCGLDNGDIETPEWLCFEIQQDGAKVWDTENGNREMGWTWISSDLDKDEG